MSRKIYQRWCAVLGMIAMLGALLAVPVSTAAAIEMTSAHAAHRTVGANADMPCHGQKPAESVKHCPGCPDKACSDMGNCLVKCFQQLTAPVSQARLFGHVVPAPVAPTPSRVNASSLVPPLLRPPSA